MNVPHPAEEAPFLEDQLFEKRSRTRNCGWGLISEHGSRSRTPGAVPGELPRVSTWVGIEAVRWPTPPKASSLACMWVFIFRNAHMKAGL